MKIEKLTDNKIRIFLTLSDLQEQNIDLHDFMSNSMESQKLFSEILHTAETEYGFATKDYKVLLEALVTFEYNFILTVTRFPYNSNKIYTRNKSINLKKNFPISNLISLIYAFYSFDDFCNFCSCVSDIDVHKLTKKAYLYFFNDKYYLILNSVTSSSMEFKQMSLSITEFAEVVCCSDLFERKLMEYGKLIMKNNAISICNKFFVR